MKGINQYIQQHTFYIFARMKSKFESEIFRIRDDEGFQKLALDIFIYQARANPVYNEFISRLNIDPQKIKHIKDIPFLPVELFKTHRIYSASGEPEQLFESSGTTGMVPSRHYLFKKSLYTRSFSESFRIFYGTPENKCLLALLPSYIERGNSSLIYMMDHLIKMSHHRDSGFYLDNLEKLSKVLEARIRDGVPTLLLGVSFALLDLAERFPLRLSDNITIMETGGMKGRRDEITRHELHAALKKAFHVNAIHSEYGMTEMLSQAYSKNDGIFRSPPWLRVNCRDTYDPRSVLPLNLTGGINIIDLANIYSCCFIATSDLGKVYGDGSFEVLGRYDQSDIRGCNLLIA